MQTMQHLQTAMLLRGITLCDITQVLGCTEAAAHQKVTGEQDFTYAEACLLHRRFFPDLRMEYLFSR